MDQPSSQKRSSLDIIIDLLKSEVDLALLRRNLSLSVEQRLENHRRSLGFREALINSSLKSGEH